MLATWIVSERPQEALSNLPSGHVETVTAPQFPGRLSTGDCNPPDILILDLDVIDDLTRRCVHTARQGSPEVYVIAVRPSAEECSPLELGVDEIQCRDGDTVAHAQNLAARLASRIAAIDRIRAVQDSLRQEMARGHIVARSPIMMAILDRLPRLASMTSTVLIHGETGTGKEQIARALHYLGPRARKPFITIDCGSLSDTLAENELFGHARGAYTDAKGPLNGLIREADGGTLFLDEIEALPLHLQPRFLRLLQEKEVRPLGQSYYTPVDVRVVAATNTELSDCVARRTFREDLFYRLIVVPLRVPPLRERREDIPHLVRHFLKRHGGDQNREVSGEIVSAWSCGEWPGNVRELENKVQEWLTLPVDSPVTPVISPVRTEETIRPFPDVRRESMQECERRYFRKLMAVAKGNISVASRLSSLDRKSIRTILRRHGLATGRTSS